MPQDRVKNQAWSFYFANGTYADLWHGYIEDDSPAVAVKVWRGVKLSR